MVKCSTEAYISLCLRYDFPSEDPGEAKALDGRFTMQVAVANINTLTVKLVFLPLCFK